MASKNLELKVGLLVIAAVAIFIFAVWLAKGHRYGQQFYAVSIMFPEVGALGVGDPVAVSGVTKGKVKKIALDEGMVRVEIDLSSDIMLKEDAVFIIKNIGLMGERFVAVKTGVSQKRLDLSRPAIGGFDAGIPEVMGMMGEVIDRMNTMTGSLERTAVSPATLDKFTETINNLQSISQRLEAATAKNLPKIDRTVANLTDLSDSLKAGFRRNLTHIDSAAQNFDAGSQRFAAILSDFEDVSARLKSFAHDLDESQGSLRMFMEDRRLYDDLRTTAQNLDSLVSEIRANPKKYINFTVELF